MKRSIAKKFYNVKFTPTLIREAFTLSSRLVGSKEFCFKGKVSVGETTYDFSENGDYPAEALRLYQDRCEKGEFFWFFTDSNGATAAMLVVQYEKFDLFSSRTIVTFEHVNSASGEQIIDLFEKNIPSSSDLAIEKMQPRKQVVFVGHGRSPAWRELKDHLSEKHGFAVEAYETGARSGHHIRDILEGMAKNATIAFLVHTAEDESNHPLRAAVRRP